jgi:hypothetical protein
MADAHREVESSDLASVGFAGAAWRARYARQQELPMACQQTYMCSGTTGDGVTNGMVNCM